MDFVWLEQNVWPFLQNSIVLVIPWLTGPVRLFKYYAGLCKRCLSMSNFCGAKIIFKWAYHIDESQLHSSLLQNSHAMSQKSPFLREFYVLYFITFPPRRLGSSLCQFIPTSLWGGLGSQWQGPAHGHTMSFMVNGDLHIGLLDPTLIL